MSRDPHLLPPRQPVPLASSRTAPRRTTALQLPALIEVRIEDRRAEGAPVRPLVSKWRPLSQPRVVRATYTHFVWFVTIENATDKFATIRPHQLPVTGVYKFRVGVRRSGSTDTITSADLSYREDGVNV